MTIDLKQFCAKGFESETRPYLSVPFSSGEFTYATNGHLCVRVARRDDACEAEGDQVKCVETLCKTLDVAKDQPLSAFARALPNPLPPGECEACGGTGEIRRFRRVRFESFDIHEKYLRMLVTLLPGLKIGGASEPAAPVLFGFDGGIGLVMPLAGRDLFESGLDILVSDLPLIEAAEPFRSGDVERTGDQLAAPAGWDSVTS